MSETLIRPYPVNDRWPFAWNPELTRENPGTHWHLLYAVCEYVQMPKVTLIRLGSAILDNTQRLMLCYKPKELLLKYEGHTYYPDGMRHIKGGSRVYTCTDGSMLDVNARFEAVATFRTAQLAAASDLCKGLVLHAGSYKDDLGGGWHANVKLLEFQGHYYAPDMEVGSSNRDTIITQLGFDRQTLTL